MSEMELKQHRQGIETLYTDTCDIIERQKSKDPITRQTIFTEVIIRKNQPCRISFKTITAAKPDGNATSVSQVVKLFIAPEIDVPNGSKITVKRDDRELHYQRSGVPAYYPTHQEIVLDIWERWA